MQNAIIANRIKVLCKQQNLSISQMLIDCGLTKSFIYDLEKRSTSPSCERIVKIAQKSLLLLQHMYILTKEYRME